MAKKGGKNSDGEQMQAGLTRHEEDKRKEEEVLRCLCASYRWIPA